VIKTAIIGITTSSSISVMTLFMTIDIPDQMGSLDVLVHAVR
jgi:hypothetical protein